MHKSEFMAKSFSGTHEEASRTASEFEDPLDNLDIYRRLHPHRDPVAVRARYREFGVRAEEATKGTIEKYQQRLEEERKRLPWVLCCLESLLQFLRVRLHHLKIYYLRKALKAQNEK